MASRINIPESPVYKDNDAVDNAFIETPKEIEELPEEAPAATATTKRVSVATKNVPVAVQPVAAAAAAAAAKTAAARPKAATAPEPAKKSTAGSGKPASAPVERKHKTVSTPAPKKQQKTAPPKRGRKSRMSRLIDDEVDADEDDDDDDDDEDQDDDDEDEDEAAVVEDEGGLEDMDFDDEDDGRTVTISQKQSRDDAKLMTSKRRRGKKAESDDEDAEAKTKPSSKRSSSSRKKQKTAEQPRKSRDDEDEDGASCVTTKPIAAAAPAAPKQRAEKTAPAAAAAAAAADIEAEEQEDADELYDIDRVLIKNAKKQHLVPRDSSMPMTTGNVRRVVERKNHGVVETVKMKLIHFDSYRKCAYSKKDLMKPNTANVYHVDMENFLHFAPLTKDNSHEPRDILSFFMEKDGTMCTCNRKFVMLLIFFDFGCNYDMFASFYNNLSENIKKHNKNGVPPVPFVLYTMNELKSKKPVCPSLDTLMKYVGQCKSSPTAAGDGVSVFGGGCGDDDNQSMVTTRPLLGPRAQQLPPQQLTRSCLPPPVAMGSAFSNFGVYTNVNLNTRFFDGMEIVSRRYGPGSQLPLGPFLGNPLARLVLEFGPMCPTEHHAVYFANVIRGQLAAHCDVVDGIIREEQSAAAPAFVETSAAAAAVDDA